MANLGAISHKAAEWEQDIRAYNWRWSQYRRTGRLPDQAPDVGLLYPTPFVRGANQPQEVGIERTFNGYRAFYLSRPQPNYNANVQALQQTIARVQRVFQRQPRFNYRRLVGSGGQGAAFKMTYQPPNNNLPNIDFVLKTRKDRRQWSDELRKEARMMEVGSEFWERIPPPNPLSETDMMAESQEVGPLCANHSLVRAGHTIRGAGQGRLERRPRCRQQRRRQRGRAAPGTAPQGEPHRSASEAGGPCAHPTVAGLQGQNGHEDCAHQGHQHCEPSPAAQPPRGPQQPRCGAGSRPAGLHLHGVPALWRSRAGDFSNRARRPGRVDTERDTLVVLALQYARFLLSFFPFSLVKRSLILTSRGGTLD